MAGFSIPLQGLSNAAANFNLAATKIARASVTDGTQTVSAPFDIVDLSAQIVAILESKNAYQANLSVARTEDQMQQSLLNVLG